VLIQGILLAAVVGLLLVFVRNSQEVRVRASKRVGFFAFLLFSAYAVMRPDDVTWVAQLVGVGRGTDLLLYMLVVAFAFAVLNFNLRLRDKEQRLTDLARATALRDAEILNRQRGLLPTEPTSGQPGA
jgi:small membrane protein